MKTLKKEKIDKVFKNANEQADYFSALYRIAFPDWDNIQHIDGYPKVSEETSKYIFTKAIKFDKEKHPDVMNGGLWLDQGFGHGENLKDWRIYTGNCKITYN